MERLVGAMARYLIERTFFVDEAEMSEVSRRSIDIAAENFPDIKWEHSHVVLNDAGQISTVCIYDAPDEDTVRKHADMLGNHRIDSISEIVGDVSPGDFPAS
jgi:hypothetical protein